MGKLIYEADDGTRAIVRRVEDSSDMEFLMERDGVPSFSPLSVFGSLDGHGEPQPGSRLVVDVG